MKPSNVSKCCGSSISVVGGDEGTMFFVCDACHKPCDLQLDKIKSPPFNLKRFKESAQKAKETFTGDDKITKAPVGANGVNTGSSKNYKSIITWALKELGWDTPGWTYEKKVLNRLIKLAEQRGYERGLVEAHKNDYTTLEIDDLLKRTEQEGYDRAKRELSVKYGGQG